MTIAALLKFLASHLGFLFALALALHLLFSPAASPGRCIEVAFFVAIWMMPMTIFAHAFTRPPRSRSQASA